MRFLVDVVHSRVAVGNSVYNVNTSTLPSNVFFVFFDSANGLGAIQYTDRPGSLEDFGDPLPYEPYIESWLTAAGADNPPLTTVQAQQIKSGLVEALYNAYRQLPINVGGNTYSALDKDVAALVQEMSVAASQAQTINPVPNSFTTSQTITIPAGVTSASVVLVGDGGGARGSGSSVSSAGGGGVAQKFLTGLTPGNTLTLSVGPGGSGATTPPSDGSGTSLSSGTQSISTITAGGGLHDTLGAGGQGGTISGADSGYVGVAGVILSSSAATSGYAPGYSVPITTGSNTPGALYGGGGLTNSSSGSRESGGAGLAIITWYGQAASGLALTATQLVGGAPQLASVSLSTLQNILTAIKVRSDTLNSNRQSLQALIAAAGSVAAVVAVVIKNGWPSYLTIPSGALAFKPGTALAPPSALMSLTDPSVGPVLSWIYS